MKITNTRPVLYGLLMAIACSLLPSSGKSQDVILQGFYWNSNPGDLADLTDGGIWWDTLTTVAPYLADAGFQTVWLPPANKGFAGAFDMGYGIYDYYDFGEFNQKGPTVRTRHGNRTQLENTIQTLHNEGLLVMADLVLNHRGGGDAEEPEDCDDGQGPTDRFTDFNPLSGRLPMDAADFHPNFTHCDVTPPYRDRIFFEDLCYFNFLDQQLDPGQPNDGWYFGPHNLGRAGDSLIVWGRFLLNEMGVDELRLDAVKHIEPGFLAPFLVELNDGPQPYAVGELFDGNLGALAGYRNDVEGYNLAGPGLGSKDANLAIFDFNLRYALRDMCNNAGGGFDMSSLNNTGLRFGAGLPGEDIVNFVENHDVDRIGYRSVNCADPHDLMVGSTCLELFVDGTHDPVFSDKEDMGYPYIMAAEGRPSVFWKDIFWFDLDEDITWQMALREATATGGSVRMQDLGPFFTNGTGSQDFFVMNRNGTTLGGSDGMVLALNDNPSAEGSAFVTTPFSDKYLKDYSDGYLFQSLYAPLDSRTEVKAQPRDYAWWSVTGLYPHPPGTPAPHFNMNASPGGGPHFIALRAADAPNLLVNGAPIEVGDEVAVRNGNGDIVGIGRIGQSSRWDGVHDMIIEVLGAPSANGMANGEAFTFVVYDQTAGMEFAIGSVQYAPTGTAFNFSPERPNSPNRNGNFSSFSITTNQEGNYALNGISLVLALDAPLATQVDFCGEPSRADALVYNDGLQATDNDGAGFLNWTNIIVPGNASEGGIFIGTSLDNNSPSGNDSNNDGDIDSGGEAFGFYHNVSSGIAEATRPFASPLIPGARFSIQMDNGGVDGTNGAVGFSLRNASGNNLMEFYFRQGQANYKIRDNGGQEFDTGIPFTREGLALELELLTTGTYTLTVTRLENGALSTFSNRNMDNPAGGQAIDRVRLFNYNAGSLAERNVYFNNLALCYPPALVINEVDYDQPGTDEQEFIELKNVSPNPINLDNYLLELINGNGNLVYTTLDLPNVNLSAGDYYVICAAGSSVPNCDFNFAGAQSNRIENGSPDAIRLRWNGITVDALSYEGDVPGATEGTGVATADGDNNSTESVGLSRVPDGNDTDQNAADFQLVCITPGLPNSPDQTDTDGDDLPDACDPCPTAVDEANIPNFVPADCACLPGYYAVTSTVNGQEVIVGCQECPPGSFCPDGINQVPCGTGTFQNLPGQTSCQDCPAGRFQSQPGQTFCQDCPAGTFSSTTGAVQCTECAEGTYNPNTGATFCQACPTGTFTDNTGNAVCETCEPGSTATNAGQQVCDNCTPPSFSDCSTVPAVDNSNGACEASVTVPTPILADDCTRNHALNFDGVDDYVSIPFLFNPASTPFTVEAWVLNASTGGTDQVVVQQTDGSGTGRTLLGVRSTGRVYSVLGNLPTEGGTNLALNTWYHLALSYDGATLRLFVNGVEDAVSSRTAGSTVGGLRLGTDKNGNFSWQGAIDEVRIWNVARTETEIQAAKDLEINSTYPGLIAYYDFNEGVACCDNTGLTTLPDQSGNTNDGTLNNFDLNGGCPSNWTAGAPALGDPLTLVNDVTGDCDASGTYAVGAHTITWTATGANGSTATCTQTVTVQDTSAPVLTCTADTIVGNDAGECFATLNLPRPDVTDNCPINNSLDFDGVDDHVEVGDMTFLENATSFTIEAWVYPDGLNTNFEAIFSLFETVENRIEVTFGAGSGPANRSSLLGIVGNNWGTTSLGSITIDAWNHIAVVYDGTQAGSAARLKIYINGVQQSLSFSGSIPASTPMVNALATLGRRSSTLPGIPADLKLDDLRIWTIPRDQADIMAEMNQQISPSTPGLAAYYNFNQGIACSDNPADTVLNDLTTNHEGDLKNFDLSGCLADTCQSNWAYGAPALGGTLSLVNDFNNSSALCDEFPAGITTVTWTATDDGGNTETCEQTVVVHDTTPPMAVCTDITIQLGAGGEYGLTTANIDAIGAGSDDNCYGVLLEVAPDTFRCEDLGANTVTLTVTEDKISDIIVTSPPSGLIGHWTFEPGIEEKDLTGNFQDLTLGGSASFSGGVLDVDGAGDFGRGVIDPLSGVSTITNKTLVSYISLDDLNVNSGSALTLDRTNADVFDGIIYAERQAFRWMNGSNSFVRTQDFSPGFAESTTGELVQMAITYEVSGTNVIIRGYRNGELIGSYTDNGPVGSWDATNAEVILGARHILGASDVRGALDAKIEEALIFDRALSQAEIQALGAGLSATCTATVTVEDPNSVCNQPPVASCQDITVNADANCQGTAVAADFDNNSTDPDGDPLTFSVSPAGPYVLGPTDITLTVTDDDNASSTCTATVTVEDNEAPGGIAFPAPAPVLGNVPEASGYSLVYQLDIPSTPTNWDVPADVPYSVDNTAALSSSSFDRIAYYMELDGEWIWVSVDAFTGDVTQTGIPVDWTYDQLLTNMNVASNASGIVTGTGIATGNIEFWSDCYATNNNNSIPGSSGTIYDTDDQSNNDDDCYGSFQIHNHGANQTLFALNRWSENANNILDLGIGNSPSGIHPDWTFRSNANTYSTKRVYVFVNAGGLDCLDPTVSLDGSGAATITVADIDNNNTDNCAIDTRTLDITSFDCSDVGPNTVVLTITDESGNSSTCSATVTVEDNQAPTVTCPGNQTLTTSSDGPGDCTATYTIADPLDDNCPGATWSAAFSGNANGNPTDVTDIADGSDSGPITFQQGTTTVTLSATDASGNPATTCSFTVTVNDDENPTITLQGNSPQIHCFGTTYTDAGATATDNCEGNLTGSISTNNPVDENTAGMYTVTYDVMDAAGNDATQVTRTVQVVDPQATPSASSDMFCSPGSSGITVGLNDDADAFNVSLNVTSGAIDGGAPADRTNQPDGALLEPATLENTGNVDAVIEYTITPYHYGQNGVNDNGAGDDCTGPSQTVTLTVQPEPVGADLSFEVCDGALLNIDLQAIVDTAGNALPSDFTWVAASNPDVTGENTISQSGTIINNQLELVDPSGGPVTVTYTVSPTGLNGCPGEDFTVTVTVQACEVEIIDPCTCLDNATTQTNGQFSELIEVTGPDGDDWEVVSAPGLYLSTSPAPPTAPTPVPAGTPLPEGPDGTYTLTARHIDAQGYTIVVTNGDVQLSVSNVCYYPNVSFTNARERYCVNSGENTIGVEAQLGAGGGAAPLEQVIFTLFDSEGNQVYTETVTAPDAAEYTFDPADFGQGNYTLRAEFDADDAGTNEPGCIQPIETSFRIQNVGCGSFPWDGE